MPTRRAIHPYHDGTSTFLFTDISGSTRILRRLGEQYSAVLREHREIIREAVTAHGARHSTAEADGFFALFDYADDAVGAALDAQLGLASHDWGEAGPVLVRMGLHTGDARIGSDGVVGLAVHVGARVGASAHGGQVVLSEATASEVEGCLPGETTLTDLGRHRLKDVTRPLLLYQLRHPRLPSTFPRLQSTEAWIGAVPEAPTTFIGREAALAEADDLMARSRLLTVTGPGGCGKTRFVMEMARRRANNFPDGVHIVDLAEATSGDEVAARTGAALQLGSADEAAVVSFVADRELVLVLDNCEHLTAECSRLAARIIATAAGVRVVATSREPLGTRGEVCYPLGPLAVPDLTARESDAAVLATESARLLLDRVRLRIPGFAVRGPEVGALAALCAGLEGNPLALELAASRVGVLSIRECADRLRDRFRLLGGDSPAGRQQTLHATVEWSYRMLEAPERALLERLAVFSGGATLEAVVAVCAEEGTSEWHVLDLLGALVAKSLLLAEPGEPATRYRQLETIREFCLARLRDSGADNDVRRRHSQWVADFVGTLAPRLDRPDPGPALRALRGDHQNIAAAIGWAHDSGACKVLTFIVGSLREYFVHVASLDEHHRWVEWALDCGGDGTSRLDVLIEAIYLSRLSADPHEAVRGYRLLEEATVTAQSLGDVRGEVRARLTYLVEAFEGAMPPEDLATQLAALMPEIEAVEIPPYVALALSHQALALRRMGRPAEARPVLARARALGDRAALIQPYVDYQSGMVALEMGDPTEARRHLEQSLASRLRTGDTDSTAICLGRLGVLLREAGEADEGLRLLSEAVATERRSGWSANLALLLADLAATRVACGDLDGARSALAEAADTGATFGRYSLASVAFARGEVARAEGRAAEARRHYEEAQRLAGEYNFSALTHLAEARMSNATVPTRG